MDEHLEIETILGEMDFSKGHKEAVWEKIKAQIKDDIKTNLSNKDNNKLENPISNINNRKC